MICNLSSLLTFFIFVVIADKITLSATCVNNSQNKYARNKTSLYNFGIFIFISSVQIMGKAKRSLSVYNSEKEVGALIVYEIKRIQITV